MMLSSGGFLQSVTSAMPTIMTRTVTLSTAFNMVPPYER